MGQDAPPPRGGRTEVNSRDGQNACEIEKKEGNRESQNCTLSEQIIHCTKERLSRRKIDSRSVNPQQLYQVSSLQDVDYKGGKVTSSQRLLDSFNRPQRWILACTSIPNKEALSGIPLEKAELAIQSNAFRPQCGPTLIYQSHSTCGKSNVRGRDMVPTISRRPLDSSSHTGRVLTSYKTGNCNSGISGLDTEHREITPNTCSKVRVVGSPVRPHYAQGDGSREKTNLLTATSNRSANHRTFFSEKNYEFAGSFELVGKPRSDSQTDVIKNKKNTKVIQKSSFRLSNLTKQKHETQSVQVDYRVSSSTKLRNTMPRHHNSNRCLTERLGISDKQQPLLRKVRCFNYLHNKHSGDIDNLVFSTDDQGERHCNPNSLRQLNSYLSSQEGGISYTPPVDLVRTDMEKSRIISVDHLHSTHSGLLQCVSRSALPRSGIINRMVPCNQGLSENSEMEPLASGRSVCNQPQQSASYLHFPLPRQQSSSSGCNLNILGPVEASVSLPTDKFNFESSSEVDVNTLQERSVSYTRNTHQTMVYGTETTQCSLSPIRSPSPTNSGGPPCDKITSFETSRLAIIKTACERKFPGCNEAVDLMAVPLRQVSINDYQRKWERFIAFLTDEGTSPEELSISCVLRFFTYLFSEKGLKPGTVAYYRTALS